MKKVLLIILGLTLTAFAFWPSDGLKVIETPDEISNPQMVYIEDGSAIISWEQHVSPSLRHIYCQKLDTAGVIHWDAGGVRVCLNDSNQYEHQIVTDGQDVWFVWTDMRNEEAGDIYAQKISGTTGQRLWGEEGKAVCVKQAELFSQQMKPRCALLANEALGVAWEDFPDVDIYVQYIQPDGVLLWDSTGLGIPNEQHWARRDAHVVSSGEDFIVSYHENRPSQNEYGVVFQKFNQAAEYLFGTTNAPSVDSFFLYGSIEDEQKGCIVFVTKAVSPYVYHIDSLGNPLWGDNGIQLENHELKPRMELLTLLTSTPYTIIPDGYGGCFVSWIGFLWSQRAQYIEHSGNLFWDKDLIIYQNEDETIDGTTKLCPDGTGGIFAIFSTRLDSPDWYEASLKVQRVDASGEKVFDSDGIKLQSTTSGLDYSIKDAVPIPSGVMTAWVDDRNDPQWSLYAQTVDTTGKIGSNIEEEELPVTTHPNFEVVTGLGSQIVLSYLDFPASSTLSIVIYDALGRLVDQVVLRGQTTVTWPVTPDTRPPGVYFIREVGGSSSAHKVILVR